MNYLGDIVTMIVWKRENMGKSFWDPEEIVKHTSGNLRKLMINRITASAVPLR